MNPSRWERRVRDSRGGEFFHKPSHVCQRGARRAEHGHTHTHWPDRVHWSGRGLTLDLSRRDRPRSWESEFKSQPEPRHHDNPEVRVLNLTLEELQTDQRFPSGLAHYPSPWPHQGSVRQPDPFSLLRRCRTNETVTFTGSRENVLTKNTEA